MAEVKRIDINQFNMANEKVSESVHLYIQLSDDYFIYAAEYYGEEPIAEDKDDHAMGWKEMYQNFFIKIKRQSLVSLDKNWNNKREFWQVEVEANGYPNTIKLYFKTEKEAQGIYDTLDKFIFN